MKKYFIFSDIHGRKLSALLEELKNASFDINDDNHILISLGDLFDRGDDNLNLLFFVNEMIKKNRMIVLWGNHEAMLKEFIETSFKAWSNVLNANGTSITIYDFLTHLNNNQKLEEIGVTSFLNFFKYGIVDKEIKPLFNKLKSFEELNFYFSSLKPYYVLNNKYLLCHSGATNMEKYSSYDLKKIMKETFSCIIPLFKNSAIGPAKNVLFDKHNFDKVIHGHLYVHYFNIDDPYNIYFGENNICLDSYFHINVLVIDENNNISHVLYTNEKKIKDVSNNLKKRYKLE